MSYKHYTTWPKDNHLVFALGLGLLTGDLASLAILCIDLRAYLLDNALAIMLHIIACVKFISCSVFSHPSLHILLP